VLAAALLVASGGCAGSVTVVPATALVAGSKLSDQHVGPGASTPTGGSFTAGNARLFKVAIPPGATEICVVVLNFGLAIEDLLQVLVGQTADRTRPGQYQQGPFLCPESIATEVISDLASFDPAQPLDIAVVLEGASAGVDFSLFVTFDVVSADSGEPNDSAATAPNVVTVHDITRGPNQHSPLSITPGDIDYFVVDLFLAGTVELEATYAIGKADLQVELLSLDEVTRFTADPATVGEDTLLSSRNPPPVAGLPAGQYLIKVYGLTAADAGDYTLFVDRP